MTSIAKIYRILELLRRHFSKGLINIELSNLLKLPPSDHSDNRVVDRYSSVLLTKSKETAKEFGVDLPNWFMKRSVAYRKENNIDSWNDHKAPFVNNELTIE